MITYLLLSILTVVLQSNLTETNDTSPYINCYYYNATSIRGKLNDFNQHFDPLEYDIVSVREDLNRMRQCENWMRCVNKHDDKALLESFEMRFTIN